MNIEAFVFRMSFSHALCFRDESTIHIPVVVGLSLLAVAVFVGLFLIYRVKSKLIFCVDYQFLLSCQTHLGGINDHIS